MSGVCLSKIEVSFFWTTYTKPFLKKKRFAKRSFCFAKELTHKKKEKGRLEYLSGKKLLGLEILREKNFKSLAKKRAWFFWGIF